jgi:uncharacterized protein (DUF1330 family)
MAAYLIADTVLTNPELYEQYKLKAKPLAERYGGEYLARGGQLTVKESDLWTPARIVLIRFASTEQAQAFYDCAEYQEVLKISAKSAKRTICIIEGV